jgi:TatA/E family protein of Tat protein translocase
VFALILESLGATELLFILAIALIFFGPRKLPQLARSMGKGLAEFRRASDDFKRTWEREVALETGSAEEQPFLIRLKPPTITPRMSQMPTRAPRLIRNWNQRILNGSFPVTIRLMRRLRQRLKQLLIRRRNPCPFPLKRLNRNLSENMIGCNLVL